jgi:hypothetical protein
MQAKNEALKSESFDRTQNSGNQATYRLEDAKQYTSQGKYT